MRKSLLFSFFILSISAHAQEQEGTSEIGLNMSQFMQNFLGFGTNEIQENNASTLLMKFSKNGHKFFRLGVDMQYVESNTESVNSSNGLIGLKLGYESRKTFSEKWEGGLGVDAVLSYNDLVQETTDPFFGTSEVKRNEALYGAEMVFLAKYNLSPRVSLSTESYILLAGTQTSGSGTTKRSGFQFSVIAPTSLYLSLRF